MNEPALWTALSCAIILFAGLVQGLTGFGFALVAMPLLLITIGLQEAVIVIVMLSLATNIAVLVPIRGHVRLRSMWTLAAASFIAVPFGAWLLLAAPAPALKAAAGALVVIFALLQLRGVTLPIRSERIGYPVAGALAGLLNGSISLSGPPVALFLSNSGMDKQSFRANLSAFGVALNIVTIGVFASQRLLTPHVMKTFLIFFPAMLIGVLAGILAARRIGERSFKKIILMLLVISGLWTLWSGIR